MTDAELEQLAALAEPWEGTNDYPKIPGDTTGRLIQALKEARGLVREVAENPPPWDVAGYCAWCPCQNYMAPPEQHKKHCLNRRCAEAKARWAGEGAQQKDGGGKWKGRASVVEQYLLFRRGFKPVFEWEQGEWCHVAWGKGTFILIPTWLGAEVPGSRSTVKYGEMNEAVVTEQESPACPPETEASSRPRSRRSPSKPPRRRR